LGNDLSAEDIKLVHRELEKKFPLMLKGIQQEGLIQAVIERQNTKLYGSDEQYEGVYKKAAALMEAITRWHIFNDGNKRTGLLCAFLYLYINKRYLVIPIDAVRFTQKIAATTDTDQDSIEKLIMEIASWLKQFSAENSKDFTRMAVKYTLLPSVKLTIMKIFGMNKRVQKRLDYLFATDAHPEYKKEMEHTFSFLSGFMWESMLKIIEINKPKPRDLQLPNFDPMQCAIGEHEITIATEEKLYHSEIKEDGMLHYDSECAHCSKKLHLMTDPQNPMEYFIEEIEE